MFDFLLRLAENFSMSQDYLLFVNTGLIVRWVISAARYCQISAPLIGKDRISIENRLWDTNILGKTISFVFVLKYHLSRWRFLKQPSYLIKTKSPVWPGNFPSLGWIIPRLHSGSIFFFLFHALACSDRKRGFVELFQTFLTLVSPWLVLGSSEVALDLETPFI